MNTISNRIKEVAKLIAPFRKIADIGCDHGYLICEALDNDYCDFALGIDNKIGPITSAKNNLASYDKSKYDLLLSNGIDDLPDDIECILILGMGGILITEILSNFNKLQNVKRIILQPNKNSFEVRKFMTSNGYKITNEKIIFDNKKYYEIIVFEKGFENYSSIELKYGPINLKEKTPTFKDYITSRIVRLKNVAEEKEIKDKIKEMEEIL